MSNNDVDCGPPPTQTPVRVSSDGLGALSAAAAANSPSPSALAAATTTALGLLTNNNGSNNSDPLLTSLSASGSMGSIYSQSSHGLWGQSSTLSSVPLLSPSELTSASEAKGNSSNDHIQALFLAQMRQRLQQQDHQGQQQLRSDSHLQPKKRQRTMMESSESSLSKALESGSAFVPGGPSNALSAGELGLAMGGLPSSLLRTASNVIAAPGNSSTLGGLSNLLSPSVADLNNAFSSNGGITANGNNMSQIQQLLRKQQLHELQQLQQLKQWEDMQRISQLQSKDAVLQLMLQQQQQQQQQALSMGNGNASLTAQLRQLQYKQDQQHNHAKSHSSPITEETVANYMRRNSRNNKNGMSNGGSQQNNMLHQMQALANRQQLDHQDNDGMPPPPSMVSAVSSLDSVAIMSMLLPSNQQNQQQQQQSSNSAASRLLGTELSLGAINGGLGGGSNFNPSMLSPMPFPPPSGLNFGMSGSAASLLGGLGGIPGANGISSMIGRAGINSICPPAQGSGLALHPSAADVIYEQRRLAAAAEVSNTVRDSSVGKPPDAFVDRDPDGRARDLPTLLVVPMDHMQLSSHQTLLRYQIEVFRAGEEDTSTHTRGRNKPVQLGQIGIRCRHCKVLPVSRRKRGSVYFPRAVEGFYQAAQNMNSTHLQTGECPLMGNALRQEFANLIATRGVSTGAGRAYWAKQARKLGLRNTENGIVFDKKEASGGSESGGDKPSETNKSSTD